jgi:hypothetical protein
MTDPAQKPKKKNDDKVVNGILGGFTILFLAAQILSAFKSCTADHTTESRQSCFDSTTAQLRTEMEESGNTTINSTSEINAIKYRYDHCQR